MEPVTYKGVLMKMTEKTETHANVECVEKELEFTALYRWQHWIRALSIVVLVITGFYIATPIISSAPNSEPTSFMYALFRSWHIIFGFVLIAVVILKSYLFIFARENKGERISFGDMLSVKTWIKQIGYYMLVSKHPKLKGVYNPLQFAAYGGFYLMILILVITGLILYVHVFHDGLSALIYIPMRFIEELVGGLAVARMLHHVTMWGVILFILVHIYLAIFNAIFGKEGGMDAIFSGLKWHKKH